MTVIGNLLKAIIAVVMIGAVIIAGLFIYNWASPLLSSTTKARSTEPVVFVINPNETVSQVADHLEKAGIIDSAFIFRARLKILNAETSIQAGTFTLTPGMDLDLLIRTLSTPENVVAAKITVIEGLRLEEIAENLGSSGIVSPNIFLQKTATSEGAAALAAKYPFIAASGKPDDKGLEGFLFPDTYEISRSGDDSSDAVIDSMLSTMRDRLTPEMLADIPTHQIEGKPATVYQILTLASIIQREGVVEDELPDISSVYWNRIAEGTVLNADPTSQYANGVAGAWWPVLSLDQLHIDSPYNTYDNRGLPPGPICNPGLAAIRAAIYPSDTKYFYFVAKNDGSGRHAFAQTLQEHERNRIIYNNTEK
ncbi:MAG: endolytic transglycosylase MltG [Chloroflexota bacterium]